MLKNLFLILLIKNVVFGCKSNDLWRDSYGNSCNDYSLFPICQNGAQLDSFKYVGGDSFNFPELNCCSCGALQNTNLYNLLPNTEKNKCTHSIENS